MQYGLINNSRNTDTLTLKHKVAASGVTVAGLHIQALLHKYSPNQPRVPSGNPDGGQWTGGGGSSGSKQPGQQLTGGRSLRRGRRNLTPIQRINRRQIRAVKRKISRIRPNEPYLEPPGGSVTTRALRSFNRRLKTLKAEAANGSFIISNGHGFTKHRFLSGFRQTKRHTRFTNITTREQYAARIYETIVNGTHSKTLRSGGTAYYNNNTRTIVIRNPNAPDGGTAYPAFNGIRAYNALD